MMFRDNFIVVYHLYSDEEDFHITELPSKELVDKLIDKVFEKGSLQWITVIEKNSGAIVLTKSNGILKGE